MADIIVKILLLVLAILLSAAFSALFGYIAELPLFLRRKGEASDRAPAAEAVEYRRAVTLCDTVPPTMPLSFRTEGFTDCAHASRTFGGFTACPNGCLALGSCMTVCPSNAISIGDGRISITDACIGCGKCVEACPRSLIKIIPLAQRTSFKCSGSLIPQTAKICDTAKNGHLLDYREFPDSFFKNLDTWGIIRKKSR